MPNEVGGKDCVSTLAKNKKNRLLFQTFFNKNEPFAIVVVCFIYLENLLRFRSKK